MSWTTDTCLYIILSDWKQCNSAPKFSSRFIEKENRWAAPWLLSVSDENNSSWEISSSSYWVVRTAATPALDWVAEKFLLHAVTASFYVNDVTVCLLPLAGGILWPICFTVAHYNSMFHQYTLTLSDFGRPLHAAHTECARWNNAISQKRSDVVHLKWKFLQEKPSWIQQEIQICYFRRTFYR